MKNLISKEEAEKKGLKRYFTGLLCKNGHLEERFVSTRQCMQCSRDKAKVYAKTDKSRDNRLKRTYGLSFSELLKTTHCEICNTELIRRGTAGNAICVDHDHLTGKVRGILCNNCNRGLGMFKDNSETIQKAINYLKEHKNDGRKLD